MLSQELYLRSKIESYLRSKFYLKDKNSTSKGFITHFSIKDKNIRIHLNEFILTLDEPSKFIENSHDKISIYNNYIDINGNLIKRRFILTNIWKENLQILEKHLMNTIIDVLGTGGDLFPYNILTVKFTSYSENCYKIILEQDLINYRSKILKISII